MAAPEKDKAQTADGGAGSPMNAAKADIVTADTQGYDDAVAQQMRDAQAIQQKDAEAMVNAREFTTPDATYSRGVEGANVNVAAPKDAPVIATYEDALEAGYFGVAAGHANTEGYSVAAVTARDRKLGLPGTGTKGAVVNGDKASESSK